MEVAEIKMKKFSLRKRKRSRQHQWKDAGVGTGRRERKSREEIYGRSERGHEVRWCERRGWREFDGDT